MDSAPVSSMVSRSIPRPNPSHGGVPARMLRHLEIGQMRKDFEFELKPIPPPFRVQSPTGNLSVGPAFTGIRPRVEEVRCVPAALLEFFDVDGRIVAGRQCKRQTSHDNLDLVASVGGECHLIGHRTTGSDQCCRRPDANTIHPDLCLG